jgi:hypothetical protein
MRASRACALLLLALAATVQAAPKAADAELTKTLQTVRVRLFERASARNEAGKRFAGAALALRVHLTIPNHTNTTSL